MKYRDDDKNTNHIFIIIFAHFRGGSIIYLPVAAKNYFFFLIIMAEINYRDN